MLQCKDKPSLDIENDQLEAQVFIHLLLTAVTNEVNRLKFEGTNQKSNSREDT
jgi:hypothetical protein